MKRRTTALAILGLLAFAPAASAEVLTATVPATSGDQAVAGRDITAVSVSYDTAGVIHASVALRGAPAPGDGVAVAVHLGTVSGTNCGPPAAIVGGQLGGTTASWAVSGGATGNAARGGGGATVTLTAQAAALASLALDCAWAQVTDGTTRLDMTDGWAALTGPAPLPPVEPPPPPPTAPQPEPQPEPRLEPAQLALSSVSRTVKRGRWTTVRVRVANSGGQPASRVRLKVGKARGASVKRRSVGWRQLAAGRAKTAKLRVKLLRRKPVRIPLRVTAAGGLRDRAAIQLSVKRKRAKPKPSGAGLAGRRFWGWVSHVDWAWDNRGVYFVDGRWAYEGLPKGGLPRCTAVTQEVDEDGERLDDGCRRYTYDKRTGKLKVGALEGTYRRGKLVLDEVKMTELTTPKAGTRFRTQLEHRGFCGLCGLITGCTTWHEQLALFEDGQFVRSSSTLSTIGGSGLPFTAVGSYPPDQRGRYTVLGGGRIRFAYADGSVSVETIGVERDASGRPDPVNGGLLLDETNFYVEDD